MKLVQNGGQSGLVEIRQLKGGMGTVESNFACALAELLSQVRVFYSTLVHPQLCTECVVTTVSIFIPCRLKINHETEHFICFIICSVSAVANIHHIDMTRA